MPTTAGPEAGSAIQVCHVGAGQGPPWLSLLPPGVRINRKLESRAQPATQTRRPTRLLDQPRPKTFLHHHHPRLGCRDSQPLSLTRTRESTPAAPPPAETEKSGTLGSAPPGDPVSAAPTLWVHPSRTRGLPGLWVGPDHVGAEPKPQFKKFAGVIWFKIGGPQRRLRGETARLAQRRGRGPGGPQSALRNPRVSRHERSHCPTQTVKKLLEEQRRRQQQPDAGGVAGQLPPPQQQTPSVPPPMSEVEAGHAHFPGHQETGGPGSQAPATGFPDWDPNMHAAYPDSTYAHPVPAAQGFPTPDFYPPWDPGRSCQFTLEDPLDARLYAEPPLAQAGSWRASGLPPGPPQLPPSAGPSLDTARAHMLALGPQQLLAQDEEGDTLLHLLAARGLRWAAYAAAEVLQAYRQLDVREHKGKTPLLVAAAANQPLIVEDLLNLGAEPNATDHRGRSILHVAATYGLPGVLSAVFNSGVQVDLEARDFEGLTALHTAILAFNVAMCPPNLCPQGLSTQARDRLACVQMLLHMGADHTSQEIKSNKTVLHLAVQAANPTLVQLLLELPRGDLRTFVNMKAHGNTALHMAAALPPGPPQEAIVRHLLAAGADPTLRNLENEQPVHLLRPGPGPEGLRQLLKRSRVAPPGLSS